MSAKSPRPILPLPDILAWMEANHPQLQGQAEIDRNWLWLAVDLRGDANKAIRESLKEFGFRFAKRGHPLPSGRVGTWAHCGVKPMPFKRKAKMQASKDDLNAEIDAALHDLGVIP